MSIPVSPTLPADPERLALLRDVEQRPLLLWRMLLALGLVVVGLVSPQRATPALLVGATAGVLVLLALISLVLIRVRTPYLRLAVAMSLVIEGAALLLLTLLAPTRTAFVLPLWGLMALRSFPLRLWDRAMGWLSVLVPIAFLLLPQLGVPLDRVESVLFALALLALVVLGVLVGAMVEQSIGERRSLAHRLVQRESDLGVRTQVLTQTATNLATRVLELRSLQEGMKAINASLALDELLAGTVQNVAQLFGGTACAIGLREADGALRIVARSSDPPLLADVLPLAERVTARGEAARAAMQPDQGTEPLPALAVPLIVEGEAIGALVACRSSDLSFSGDDQERLTAFADQAALAVNNSRLYERVASLYREVKDRSAELEAVLNSIGDAVVVTDSAGSIQLTNPVAADLLGLPDRLLPATPLPPELLQSGFAEQLHHALSERREEAVLGELTIQHSGALHRQRNYQALSAPLRGSEGQAARGVVTVLRDVTANKELEQLKQNFVGTISHELKTPLHTIKGFLNIVLAERSSGPLTEVQRDFLSTANEQTKRLERLILDLLEFNRLESGQIKLNPEPLDVAALAYEATEQFRAVAQEAQVLLTCEMPGPLMAEGDRLRLDQVLHNLIGNALKFTPAGGRVRLRGGDKGDAIELCVEDTGIGIPPEARERIFERFFQLDSAQDRRYGGTGLGLAICKHIVDRHGGRIWVEGEPGTGSRFHVWLPREQGQGSALTVDFSRLAAAEA